MDKADVINVLSELKRLQQLPAGILEKAARLEQEVNRIPDGEFSQWTDGVVTASLEDINYNTDDLNMKIEQLYREFNDFLRSHREWEQNEEVSRILHRLTGMVGVYDRDFP